MLMFSQVVAVGCLGWYALVSLVAGIGTVQLFRYYSRPPRKPVSSHLGLEHVPHVTIIRPCKGLEPFLYECLAATFHQDYPSVRCSFHFCVASKSDKAYPILQQLLKGYPEYDARIYIEEEDPVVQEEHGNTFGPNPKIRNMSRAYREAKGDIIWIIDCNIWMGYGALGRMVDKLCGFTAHASTSEQAQMQKPYKLVAHLPVSVDVDAMMNSNSESHSTPASGSDDSSTVPLISSTASSRVSGLTGSALDMSFLSTAHAKMYVAINSVSIAPCINGKSSMFRKSHLNHLTQNQGIDFFSHNICEDHLIGDLLWKSSIRATLGFEGSEDSAEIRKSNPRGLKYRNHGLAMGDMAIQPVAGMSIAAYVARRVRWLRVRKFTVPLATLVEPGTESLVCCAMGAFGLTTTTRLQGVFGNSWSATAALFAIGVGYWFGVDWFVSALLQGMGSVEQEHPAGAIQLNPSSNIKVPPFAKGKQRSITKWLSAWAGREVFALPIWTWAIWGGTTVTWRERKFWVGMDMKVHEIPSSTQPVQSAANVGSGVQTPSVSYNTLITTPHNGNANGKARKMA